MSCVDLRIYILFFKRENAGEDALAAALSAYSTIVDAVHEYEAVDYDDMLLPNDHPDVKRLGEADFRAVLRVESPSGVGVFAFLDVVTVSHHFSGNAAQCLQNVPPHLLESLSKTVLEVWLVCIANVLLGMDESVCMSDLVL